MQEQEEKIVVTEHTRSAIRRDYLSCRADDKARIELYKVQCAARIKLYKVQCKLFGSGALPCPPAVPDFKNVHDGGRERAPFRGGWRTW